MYNKTYKKDIVIIQKSKPTFMEKNNIKLSYDNIRDIVTNKKDIEIPDNKSKIKKLFSN